MALSLNDRPQIEQQIREEALSWVGTPFHHAARVKGVGVDCVQFLIGVFSGVGLLAAFDPEPYPADWHLHRGQERYLAGLEEHAVPCAPPYQVGDVFSYRFGRCVSHCSIYLGPDPTGQELMVHAVANACVRCDQVAMPFYASRFAGAWRLHALEGV